MSAIDEILDRIPLPRVVTVRQTFPRPRIEDPGAELVARVRARGLLAGIKPGARIAITAGSRGISNMPQMVSLLGQEIRRLAGEPFIVPAKKTPRLPFLYTVLLITLAAGEPLTAPVTRMPLPLLLYTRLLNTTVLRES